MAVSFPSAFLGGLIGQSAVMGAIRTAGGRRAAISEIRAGRVAQRPAAHRLPQFDNCHPERHRQHDALVSFRFGLLERGDRQRRRAANDPLSDGAHAGRGGTVSLLGRRGAGTRSPRTRRFGSAGETQPMNLANDGVARQSVAKQRRDLACALALDPMLPELLHSFIRPGHGRLVVQSLRPSNRLFAQNPSPRPRSHSLRSTPTK